MTRSSSLDTLRSALNMATTIIPGGAFPHSIRHAARVEIDRLADSLKGSYEARSLDFAHKSKMFIRKIFTSINRHVAVAWSMGLLATVALFVLFGVLALAAVLCLLLHGEAIASAILACFSASVLIAIAFWRPYRRTFGATVMLQRLEIVFAEIEREWRQCESLEDEEEQLRAIYETNRSVLEEIGTLAG
nr:putative integron gene cassette protein [uncultured bacterium]